MAAGTTGTVGIFLRSGTSDFSPRVDYFLDGQASARALEIADVNIDGRPDVVIAISFGPVHLLLGDPNGSYARGSATTQNDTRYGLATVDLNRDGKLDILTVSEDYVGVLLNRTAL
jgi:adhesin/invasin